MAKIARTINFGDNQLKDERKQFQFNQLQANLSDKISYLQSEFNSIQNILLYSQKKDQIKVYIEKKYIEKINNLLKESNQYLRENDLTNASFSLEHADYIISIMNLIIEIIIFGDSETARKYGYVFFKSSTLNEAKELLNNSLHLQDDIDWEKLDLLKKSFEIEMLEERIKHTVDLTYLGDESIAQFRFKKLAPSSSWEKIQEVKADILGMENEIIMIRLNELFRRNS